KGLLISERHRLECENRFACLLHWPDRFLESRRGSLYTQLPFGRESAGYATSKRRLPNARDKSRRLGSSGADADDPSLSCSPCVADVNIIVPGDLISRAEANGRVVTAAGVATQRTAADGCVGVTGCVCIERI